MRRLNHVLFADIDVRGMPESSSEQAPVTAADGAIPLPDIRQVRQKKAMQEELERLAEEESETRVKIKRGDTKALRDVRCNLVDSRLERSCPRPTILTHSLLAL